MKTLVTENEKLAQFEGQWHTTGKILNSENKQQDDLRGSETYEWLPGDHFMLHKVDVTIGNEQHISYEIIGFDQNAQHYTLQQYDNKGNSRSMTASLRDGLWSILGEKLRFNGRFNQEGTEFNGVWEKLVDGEGWQEFMEVSLRKE